MQRVSPYVFPGIVPQKYSYNVYSAHDICAVVADEFEISIRDMYGKNQRHKIVRPRQVAMYLIRNLLNLTLNDIGSHFGKDHSSIVHGINTIQDHMETDMAVLLKVDELKRKLVLVRK